MEKLKITLDGKEHELFMSYRLLNRLATEIGHPDAVANVLLSAELQEKILSIALTPKGSKKLADLDVVEISVADAEKVVRWVCGHVMDFFMKGIEAAKELSDKGQERMNALMPSSAGSEPSTSEMPAAGPSASTQAGSMTSTTAAP